MALGSQKIGKFSMLHYQWKEKKRLELFLLSVHFAKLALDIKSQLRHKFYAQV